MRRTVGMLLVGLVVGFFIGREFPQPNQAKVTQLEGKLNIAQSSAAY